MSRTDGGPAFPVMTDSDFNHAGQYTKINNPGVTKREWYAANAPVMPGIGDFGTEVIAKWTFKYADAMIAEGMK